MGQRSSKKKAVTSYLDSVPVGDVLKKATDGVEEGNSAMNNKEYKEAYIAYRYSSALLGMCIQHDGLSKSKHHKLVEFNYSLQYKLQDLQALMEIEQDKKKRSSEANNGPKKEVATLSMDKLKFPKHVVEELSQKKKDSSDMSEEAQAYKKLKETMEVCRPNLPMSAVIGQKDAIEMLEDSLVDKHIRPDLFKKSHCRGALLYGPPGNGKTTIATALATVVSEASNGNMPFFKVTAANFKSKWSGQAEITLTAVFKLAQMNGPSIMFIDEVESLFMSRSEGSQNSGSGTVQVFLDLMSTYRDVFFIGATNFPWDIDEALLRRMCPTYIRMPTLEDRLEMLKKLFEDQDHFLLKKDFQLLAEKTEGYSFDDLYNVKEEVLRKIRKSTRHAKFFKKTQPINGYQVSWTPCMEYEDGATAKTYTSILKSKDGLVHPTITMHLVLHCLTIKKPSVSKETIEYSDLFFEKGKSAIDERKEAKANAKRNK